MEEYDLAINHRMSPLTGALLAAALGAVAGSLVAKRNGALVGAAAGGVGGYLLLSQKVATADPPPEPAVTRPAEFLPGEPAAADYSTFADTLDPSGRIQTTRTLTSSKAAASRPRKPGVSFVGL